MVRKVQAAWRVKGVQKVQDVKDVSKQAKDKKDPQGPTGQEGRRSRGSIKKSILLRRLRCARESRRSRWFEVQDGYNV